jgi:hypothetical protein
MHQNRTIVLDEFSKNQSKGRNKKIKGCENG